MSTRPLERIHCDLWGPSPVLSSQGFRYYVIFVDNFSRFTWFYPLKLKSDFVSVFQSFQKLVENQFKKKITQFQCDGGGEFVSTRFLTHLADCGIKQLLSCPHTPQQNGLSERKHRHITELGLTMMFNGKVPQQLWVEAFFTANFLGNLLPSSVLPDDKSPFEVLYNKAPVYTSLRVFGCKCFPYLRPYMINKMDPKSLACVFLGYNEKYKGYRCYFPPTGRVYISRHVIFDEEHFPYADLYSNFHSPTESSLLQSWRHLNLAAQRSDESPVEVNEDLPSVSHQPTQAPVNVVNAVVNDQATENDQEEAPAAPAVIVEQGTHSMTTRAKDGIRKPNPRYALFTVKSNYPHPKSVKAALRDSGWNGAMGEEITNMKLTETF